jgi:hypothetical protein
MKTYKLLATLLLSACAFAEDQPKPPKPTLTDRTLATFWRLLAQRNAAKASADKAEEALNAIQADMAKTCGEIHALQLDQTGEPACVEKPKPEAEKPAEKK